MENTSGQMTAHIITRLRNWQFLALYGSHSDEVAPTVNVLALHNGQSVSILKNCMALPPRDIQ